MRERERERECGAWGGAAGVECLSGLLFFFPPQRELSYSLLFDLILMFLIGSRIGLIVRHGSHSPRGEGRCRGRGSRFFRASAMLRASNELQSRSTN